MTKYNFDNLPNRRNTASTKWNVKDNELPLCVADMDFETCPAIKEAILKVANIGTYGYSYITDEYYQVISQWWEKRHHVKWDTKWMNFSTGVIAAISSIIRRLTNEGDYVIVQPPVYNTFFGSILHNNRQKLENNLIYKDGQYAMDFDDLEVKMSNPNAKLMILCNPHNPLGIQWDKETLYKVGQLAKKHSVIVIADEIHCDLSDPGYEYIPFSSINDTNRDISITTISGSKTFNIAGIQSACVVVPNEEIRQIVFKGLNDDEVAEPNCFAMAANYAAFTKGEEWLNELNAYIANNKKVIKDYFAKYLPHLKVDSSHATYLMWIDTSYYSEKSQVFAENLRAKTGLIVSAGSMYLGNGDNHIRLNAATSLENIMDALERIKTFVESL